LEKIIEHLDSGFQEENGGYKMNFKDFMEMYDNWNGITRVNDNNLDMIVENQTGIIMDNRKDLYDKEVVSFGFYDNVLTVRIK